MAPVRKGRFTADASSLGDEVVVFLIGMRINKPLEGPRLVAGLRRHADGCYATSPSIPRRGCWATSRRSSRRP